MKKSKKMQILFFSLIPVGILILIFSIKLVRRTFSGNIILEIPYSRKSADLVISESGNYSVWHKGQFFRKAPLDEFRPVITNENTGEKANLISLLFRPNTNNGLTARMELFRFYVTAGKYRFELAEGSSISGVEKTLTGLLPVRMVDYDKYYIQVRKSQPVYFMAICIVLMALAGLCIIGGFVIGILADQIFIKG